MKCFATNEVGQRFNYCNTCSTCTATSGFDELVFGKAPAIVWPTAINVSCSVCLLGRFVGFAANIGTSGMLSFVAVPTKRK